jgi:hypothetical protein
VHKNYFGEGNMLGKDITTRRSGAVTSRRRPALTSSLALRVMVAVAIAWLVIMAFFVTSVVSH